MSKPPRIDRKTLKNPDEFVKRGYTVMEFLAGQRSRFLPIAIVAVIALVGVFGYDWWANRSLNQAWTKYFDVTKAPQAEQVEKFKKMYEETRGTRPALFAAVNVADHYFDEAKKALLKDPKAAPDSAPTAVEWYGKGLEYKQLLPSEKQLLLINQGGAYEMQNKWTEALNNYRSASDLAGDAKGLALLSVGRAHELMSDIPKATETYEKVATDFNNTEYAKSAKNYLRRLKSPAFVGAPKS